MYWQEHIFFDPAILSGKAVIRGTRVPVYLILEKLAFGCQNEDLVKAYPRISIDDIKACLLYAAENAKIYTNNR